MVYHPKRMYDAGPEEDGSNAIAMPAFNGE
jgi:hypothetical protein